MKHANIKFTYHDYTQLPDDKHYELVEGELYLVPSPNLFHQGISINLAAALNPYVRDNGLGSIFCAPCDVVLSEITVVQPDLLFVAKERADILTNANVRGAPDLAVEIDPEGKTIEVLSWTEDGYRTDQVVPQTGTLNSPLFPGLNLNLRDIFSS
jgi:Uma2 family endonuclease